MQSTSTPDARHCNLTGCLPLTAAAPRSWIAVARSRTMSTTRRSTIRIPTLRTPMTARASTRPSDGHRELSLLLSAPLWWVSSNSLESSPCAQFLRGTQHVYCGVAGFDDAAMSLCPQCAMLANAAGIGGGEPTSSANNVPPLCCIGLTVINLKPISICTKRIASNAGPFYVPLFNVVLGFDLKVCVGLSHSVVAAGAIASCIYGLIQARALVAHRL